MQQQTSQKIKASFTDHPRPKKISRNQPHFQDWGPLEFFDGITLQHTIEEVITTHSISGIARRLGTSAFVQSQYRFCHAQSILVCLTLKKPAQIDLYLFAEELKKEFQNSFQEIYWQKDKSSLRIPTLNVTFSTSAP